MFIGKNKEISIVYKDEEIEKAIANWKFEYQTALNIQKKYDFEIPMYILTEMITPNICNLISLINLAKKNNRISDENAEILKKHYLLKEKMLYNE